MIHQQLFTQASLCQHGIAIGNTIVSTADWALPSKTFPGAEDE